MTLQVIKPYCILFIKFHSKIFTSPLDYALKMYYSIYIDNLCI
nr:MAG TPA: hypothetical protein [Inoviridae sp.]